jgi:hypothetical protein
MASDSSAEDDSESTTLPRRTTMNKQHYLLNDVAKRLSLKPYRITYALAAGLVPEPRLRIANKRIFGDDDIRRLAAHFGVILPGSAASRRKGLEGAMKVANGR